MSDEEAIMQFIRYSEKNCSEEDSKIMTPKEIKERMAKILADIILGK